MRPGLLNEGTIALKVTYSNGGREDLQVVIVRWFLCDNWVSLAIQGITLGKIGAHEWFA